MISSARHAITSFLLILCSTLYVNSQTAPGAKGSTATISGKVTIKGKGASGIVVGLRRMESSRQTTRYQALTDDQGNYRISNVPQGHYLVLAVAPVFVSEDLELGKTILINKDETVENVDIALVRGGVITGRVTDSDGRPAIEEEITLHPAQMTRGFHHLPIGVRTDDRGIYRIYGLPPGKYGVAAGLREGLLGGRLERASHKLTYYPAATDISQATMIEVSEGSEATNVDIVVGRTMTKYSAQGRIVDGATGQPLPNVRYGLQFFESESSGGSVTTGAVSNSEGEFKFGHLAPGKYAVFVEPSPDSEWRAEAVRFEVIDQDVTGLIVKTSKGASVSGVIVLEGTDDKAAQANVRRIWLHANIVEDHLPRTDTHAANIGPDGSFHIRALKAGTLAFSLSNQDRLHIVRLERNGVVYPKGIPIKHGEQMTGVRVVLNYGSGIIRGVVKVEGGTLPQNAVMQVSLRRLGEDHYFQNSGFNTARVDARGQFSMDGVLPGTYEMHAGVFLPGAPRVIRTTRQQVAVGDGSVTNVTLTVNLAATPERP